MSELAVLERPAVQADDDSAKRRQIIEGARAVFLSQGFDAASMNDIARAAGVSKGTLYVYFKHKGELFEALPMSVQAAIEANSSDPVGALGDLSRWGCTGL